MKEKQKELLLFLLEKETAYTSKELASQLNVSQRTIKNYVRELNDQDGTIIISSSQNGYLVVKNNALALLEKENHHLSVPQDYMERAYFIIKKVLVSHELVSLFDLCEELHVSYSTLKSLLTKMNTTFASFNIQFTSNNNHLRISGDEKDKRKLMSHIVYKETNNNFFNWDGLFQSYGKEYIQHLSTIVTTIFSDNHYFINDFSFMSLILHLTILINRVRSGKYIDEGPIIAIEHPNEKKIINELCSALEESFDISLTPSEVTEIYVLFKTDVNLSTPNSTQEAKVIVGEELYNHACELIRGVNQTYKVNLLTNHFMIPFALHLKRLSTRLTKKTYNKNPMINTIKQSFPMIYEIAIYISMQLEKENNFDIVEDEVAFIALHVGTEIERQQKNDDKIKCVLFCPDYMDLNSRIEQFISKDFNDELDLIASVSYQHELDNLDFDLLISTNETEPSSRFSTFQMPFFDFERSKSALYQLIEAIKLQSKSNILKENFEQYFEQSNFFVNPSFRDKNELIQIISEKMYQSGYVHHTFMANVLKREQMSSTAFGQIAIPHSVHMDAIKTSVSVIIMTNGFLWDDTSVNIILLTAINDVDRRNFRIIYEAILELFEEKNITQLAPTIATFTQFKAFVETNV